MSILLDMCPSDDKHAHLDDMKCYFRDAKIENNRPKTELCRVRDVILLFYFTTCGTCVQYTIVYSYRFNLVTCSCF